MLCVCVESGRRREGRDENGASKTAGALPYLVGVRLNHEKAFLGLKRRQVAGYPPEITKVSFQGDKGQTQA